MTVRASTFAGGCGPPGRMRDSAARSNWISRLLPSLCTGMNGIQFSGTLLIKR